MTTAEMKVENVSVSVAENSSTSALLDVLAKNGFNMDIEHETEMNGVRIIHSADGFYARIREVPEWHIVEAVSLNTEASASMYVACNNSKFDSNEEDWKYFSIEVFAEKLEQSEDGSFGNVTVEVTSVDDDVHLAAKFVIRFFDEEVESIEWLDEDYNVVSDDRNNDAWPEEFDKVANYFKEDIDLDTWLAFQRWVYSEVSEQAKAFKPEAIAA